MTSVTFEVPNISCAGCVGAIKGELSDLAGVSSVSGDADKRMIQVEFAAPATQDQIMATLKAIDYPPTESG